MGKKGSLTYTFKNGNTVELYYIGALALELGRNRDTVRKWEIAGVIPATPFKDDQNYRLYTKEQIDAIVQCASSSRIQQGRTLSTFKNRVHKALGELADKYISWDKEVEEIQNG